MQETIEGPDEYTYHGPPEHGGETLRLGKRRPNVTASEKIASVRTSTSRSPRIAWPGSFSRDASSLAFEASVVCISFGETRIATNMFRNCGSAHHIRPTRGE